MREIVRNIIYMARRFKLASTFNMIGLVVAFAAFFLLMTQIIYQRSYNHDLKDSERIYRMESDFLYKDGSYSDAVCRPFADALQHMPEVESYSLIRDADGGENFTFPFQKGDSVLEYVYTRGNTTAVSSLTNSVHGNIEWPDSARTGIIIPAQIALEYFGTTEASGKDLLYQYTDSGKTLTEPLTVQGVFEDFPENCDMKNCIYDCMGRDEDIGEYLAAYKCYVKFKQPLKDPEASATALKQAILADIDTRAMEEGSNQEIQDTRLDLEDTNFRFIPMRSSYFEHNTNTTGKSGFKAMLIVQELMCLIVIIIAIINFLNFTLAESPMRVRSLNSRLVLGATRRSLRRSLVSECVLTAVIACLIALAGCALLSLVPSASLLTDGSISPAGHPWLSLLTLAVAAISGGIAGTYPAIFATSFEPAIALKGAFGLTSQGRQLRTFLVGLQLFISMVVVCYIGILYLQSHYIFNSDYGFNVNRMLTVTLQTDPDTRDQIKRELTQMTSVVDVSLSDGILGSTDGGYVIKSNSHGQIIGYRYMYTDRDYLRVMGIGVIEGRDFEDNDSAVTIINKAAREQWDWMELGSNISSGMEVTDSARIVGVCENIRFGSTRIGNDQPFLFICDNENEDTYTMNIHITSNANQNEVRQQINELIQKHCGSLVAAAVPFDKILADTYQNELRFFRQVYVIATICMILTLIGVFCLTIFETEYRRKEIGIRKVAGATTGEIVGMLCMQYVPLILISFVAAVPLAHYLGRLTLEHFTQRTHIYWQLYPLGLLIVGGVILCTALFQSWRTARENPANSIKAE